MSADDILKLSPGEKLDSLVAIEVMDGKPGRYSTDIRDAWRVVKKINTFFSKCGSFCVMKDCYNLKNSF